MDFVALHNNSMTCLVLSRTGKRETNKKATKSDFSTCRILTFEDIHTLL